MRRDARILLSEGTSLSSREAITALGRSGRTVDICAPVRRCLGSHSKWVDRVHVMPAVGRDPAGYARGVAELCARERIDVLLPVHEQAYLFAALRSREPSWPAARTAVPVAPFRAFAAVQTKSALAATLASLGLPQPEAFLAESPDALARHGEAALRDWGACLVKADAGTASLGLRRIRSGRDLEELRAAIAGGKARSEPVPTLPGPLVIQRLVAGPLERFQGVFAEGRLVAAHCYRQLAEGPGGGDILKESVSRPLVISHMQALGAKLRWHGALSFDYILEGGSPAGPRYLDANPRLVEPVNAQLSGVDLAEILVGVAQGRVPPSLALGREGVRTRLGIMGLVERAAATGSRRAVIADFAAQVLGRGRYAGTVEELTPYAEDARSAVPFLGTLAFLAARPSLAAAIHRATVESYALGALGHTFSREIACPPELRNDPAGQ